MEVAVYNQEGKTVGKMELPSAIFDLKWNADLVHQVVTGEMANQRQSVAHAKGRSEVRGGGRKPWRQKGTGRARHGSIRSPIWKGGGVTHGPTRERVFAKKINKKMARKALATVLSAKIRDGEVLVLDTLRPAQPKTKAAARIFQNLSKIKTFSDLMGTSKRALVLLPDASQEARRALRNLPFIELEEARNVTALEALNRKYVVLPKVSVDVLAKRLGA